MCGIAGIWGTPIAEAELTRSIRGMIGTLTHRGPDGEGVWIDPARGLGLGHRRLAIIDLSADGSQPMTSSCGRYVVVFNGEIYNFIELRARLKREGAIFRGHSDTETMLAAIAAWGLQEALRHFNGMFAFALWDGFEQSLYLVRDRLGKKPLYYGQMDGVLMFGSELKALHALPHWRAEVDSMAAASFFHHGFVSGDQCILRGIRKIPPGQALRFGSPSADGEPRAYWRFEEAVADARRHPFKGSHAEAEDELAELLDDAVRIRCRADVPLGAFLSGGIDSSLVVAMMQAAGGEPTRTFSIGFSDSGYDESSSAAKVARMLGCRHTSAILGPGDLAKIIPVLPFAYDEPFADVSQVPALLVSRLARRDVTVCLSGDGGDELFGGYHRHFMAARHWPRISHIPLSLRRSLAGMARWAHPDWMANLMRGRLRTPHEKVAKILAAMESADIDELYNALLSQGERIPAGLSLPPPMRRPAGLSAELSVARQIMALDTLNYLPDDILVKIDRASMSASLELRSPLLDHRLVALSWRLPDAWLIDERGGKQVLRGLLGRYLPRDNFERQKMGFAVPIGDWLRGALRPWAEDILMSGDGEGEWFQAEEIRSRWQRHQGGHWDHGHWLWRILVWRLWRRYWKIST